MAASSPNSHSSLSNEYGIGLYKKDIYLMDLPVEILENVFKWLPFEFLTTTVAKVCTRFYALTDKITRHELVRIKANLSDLLEKTRTEYATERNNWMEDQGSISLVYLIRLAARFMLLRISRNELAVMHAVCRRASRIPGKLLDVANDLSFRLSCDPTDEDWLLNTSGQHISSKTDGLIEINSSFTTYFFKTAKRWLGLFVLDILECAANCESRVTVLHEEEIPSAGPSGECNVHGYYEVIVPELTFQPFPEQIETNSDIGSEVLFLYLHNAVRSSNKGLTVRECTQGMERNISQVCTLRRTNLGDSSMAFLQDNKRTVASSSEILSTGRRCVATHFLMRFAEIIVDKPQPAIRVDFKMTCPVDQLPCELIPEGSSIAPTAFISTAATIDPYKFRMSLKQRLANDSRSLSNLPISLMVYENGYNNITFRQFTQALPSELGEPENITFDSLVKPLTTMDDVD